MTAIKGAIAFIRQYGDSLFYWLVAGLAFSCGMFTESQIKNREISELRHEYTAQQFDSAMTQIALTARLTRELIASRNEIIAQKQQLERSIKNAVKNDGDRFTGIGDDSLRLFRQAFGYHADADNSG